MNVATWRNLQSVDRWGLNSKKAGVGVGIRDHVEDVITSMAARLYGVMDAGHAKAMSVWQGLLAGKGIIDGQNYFGLKLTISSADDTSAPGGSINFWTCNF